MYTQREEFRPSTSESQTGNCGRPSVIPVGATVRQVPKCADYLRVEQDRLTAKA